MGLTHPIKDLDLLELGLGGIEIILQHIRLLYFLDKLVVFRERTYALPSVQ